MKHNGLVALLARRINILLSPLGIKLLRATPPRSVGPDLHQLIQMPIARCVDTLGRSYGPEGTNHWVIFLREYFRNPSISIQQSSLYSHFNSFTNTDADNVWFSEIRAIDALGAFVPPRRMVYPWSPEIFVVRVANADPDRGENDWGPSSLSRIKAEHQRTINIFNSIKNSGYRPEDFLDRYGLYPYPWGVLLKKGDEFRFIVISGKHKLASLSVMGHTTVWVKFAPHCRHEQDTIPSVVDFDNAENWACVRHNIYTPEQARTLFLIYFRS